MSFLKKQLEYFFEVSPVSNTFFSLLASCILRRGAGFFHCLDATAQPSNLPTLSGAPTSKPSTSIPPTKDVTPPPASGFICPDAEFVGCTAVDPQNPKDECPTVGEPCPDSTDGEFCCRDACSRNYCTARQAPARY